MTFDPHSRVAAGVAYLDSRRDSVPELESWEQKVDLVDLNMNFGYHCILGQLFFHYREGFTRLGLDDNDAISLGFRYDANLPESESAQYKNLTAEWALVINRRQLYC